MILPPSVIQLLVWFGSSFPLPPPTVIYSNLRIYYHLKTLDIRCALRFYAFFFIFAFSAFYHACVFAVSSRRCGGGGVQAFARRRFALRYICALYFAAVISPLPFGFYPIIYAAFVVVPFLRLPVRSFAYHATFPTPSPLRYHVLPSVMALHIRH